MAWRWAIVTLLRTLERITHRMWGISYNLYGAAWRSAAEHTPLPPRAR